MSPAPGNGLTVLAVDDEPPALREVTFALRSCDPELQVLEAADSTSALRLLRSRVVDAVFLDISMPGLNGHELAAVLCQFAQPPVIVFVTAYGDHSSEAAEVGACDYVVKPFRVERIAAALTRVKWQLAEQQAHEPGRSEPEAPFKVAAERGRETRYLGPTDVQYVEANGDYVRLHAGAENFLARVPLSELESRWSGDFVRAHRAYLVRLDAITALRSDGGRHSILVSAGGGDVDIPVSRRNAREIREAMARLHQGST